MSRTLLDSPIISNADQEATDFLTMALKGFEREFLSFITKKNVRELLHFCDVRTYIALLKNAVNPGCNETIPGVESSTSAARPPCGKVRDHNLYLKYKETSAWIHCMSYKSIYEEDDEIIYKNMQSWLKFNWMYLRQAQRFYVLENDKTGVYEIENNYAINIGFDFAKINLFAISESIELLTQKKDFKWDWPWFYYAFFIPAFEGQDQPYFMEISGTFQKITGEERRSRTMRL